MKNKIFTLGAPRTGFTLLIGIIHKLNAYKARDITNNQFKFNRLINISSIYLKKEFFSFFEKNIDMSNYMYNGEFDLLVGGPKWINPENKEECVVRKYIGIKDDGDFTFLIYLPKNALDYDRVVHSHYHPKSWIDDSYYDDYTKLASIRNPMGVINSAVFSINAITSEYITKYIKDFDEDEFREIMALYKLTDLELFDGLVRFLKSYLDDFIPIMDKFNMIKWEDIITHPHQTIKKIANIIDVDVTDENVEDIWKQLDHVNIPKYHLFNFRKGFGIVGEWKQRLTNHHLEIFKKYDFDKYLDILGYEPITKFDESKYTDFQKIVNTSINNGKIYNKITDDNLFKFCWNKSNIAVTSHKFERFERESYSQVERSSLKNTQLTKDFSKSVQQKIELVNNMLREFNQHHNSQIIKDKYYDKLILNLDSSEIQKVDELFEKII